MGIKRAAISLFVAAAISRADVGFSFHADPAKLNTFRVAMLFPKEENSPVITELVGWSVMVVDGKTNIGLNPLAQYLLMLTGWIVNWDYTRKLQFPFYLTNFRLQKEFVPHSFLYFKQTTDVFMDGVYSESSVGVGIEIRKFEIYGGGAKPVLDPFNLPGEVSWRVGISKWL
jgi:hypothetical protein